MTRATIRTPRGVDWTELGGGTRLARAARDLGVRDLGALAAAGSAWPRVQVALCLSGELLALVSGPVFLPSAIRRAQVVAETLEGAPGLRLASGSWIWAGAALELARSARGLAAALEAIGAAASGTPIAWPGAVVEALSSAELARAHARAVQSRLEAARRVFERDTLSVRLAHRHEIRAMYKAAHRAARMIRTPQSPTWGMTPEARALVLIGLFHRSTRTDLPDHLGAAAHARRVAWIKVRAARAGSPATADALWPAAVHVAEARVHLGAARAARAARSPLP